MRARASRSHRMRLLLSLPLLISSPALGDPDGAARAAGKPDAGPIAELRSQVEELRSQVDAVRESLADERFAGSTFVVVTRNAVAVTDESDVDVAQAPVWGLVRAAQAGEAPARDELARRMRPMALHWSMRLLGDAEDAQDVAQEALLRLFVHFDRFDTARPPWPWLRRIVTNAAVDTIRSRRRRERSPPSPGGSACSDTRRFPAASART